MSATNYTIKIDQGSDKNILVTLKDSENEPINLTGYVFTGQIRKTVTDLDIQASFEFEILDQTDPDLVGKFFIKLPAQSSTDIILPQQRCVDRKITKMVYDIESEFNGAKKRWLEGIVEISPEVTR
jgi:hypothetical protein